MIQASGRPVILWNINLDGDCLPFEGDIFLCTAMALALEFRDLLQLTPYHSAGCCGYSGYWNGLGSELSTTLPRFRKQLQAMQVSVLSSRVPLASTHIPCQALLEFIRLHWRDAVAMVSLEVQCMLGIYISTNEISIQCKYAVHSHWNHFIELFFFCYGPDPWGESSTASHVEKLVLKAPSSSRIVALKVVLVVGGCKTKSQQLITFIASTSVIYNKKLFTLLRLTWLYF